MGHVDARQLAWLCGRTPALRGVGRHCHSGVRGWKFGLQIVWICMNDMDLYWPYRVYRLASIHRVFGVWNGLTGCIGWRRPTECLGLSWPYRVYRLASTHRVFGVCNGLTGCIGWHRPTECLGLEWPYRVYRLASTHRVFRFGMALQGV